VKKRIERKAKLGGGEAGQRTTRGQPKNSLPSLQLFGPVNLGFRNPASSKQLVHTASNNKRAGHTGEGLFQWDRLNRVPGGAENQKRVQRRAAHAKIRTGGGISAEKGESVRVLKEDPTQHPNRWSEWRGRQEGKGATGGEKQEPCGWGKHEKSRKGACPKKQKETWQTGSGDGGKKQRRKSQEGGVLSRKKEPRPAGSRRKASSQLPGQLSKLAVLKKQQGRGGESHRAQKGGRPGAAGKIHEREIQKKYSSVQKPGGTDSDKKSPMTPAVKKESGEKKH